MPTEAQFLGIKFEDTRDYRGPRFQDYLSPNTFEPLVSLAGLGAFQDAIDEDRLIPCWQPTPRVGTRDGTNLKTVAAGRQSPLPIRGTYVEDTVAEVFYWVGSNQYRIAYQLIPLSELTAEDIIEYDQLNAFQRLLVEVVPRVANLFPQGESNGNESNRKKRQRLAKIVKWFQDNQVGAALGVWVQVSETITPIAEVSGVNFDSDNGFKTTPKVDFLGLLVSGVGIFTGNPLLIGGGLVLSFIQGRQESKDPFRQIIPTENNPRGRNV